MIRTKSNKLKFIILPVFIILILGIIIFINIVFKLKEGEKVLSTMTFDNIDITSIESGTYFGDCEVGLVYVEVKTVVDKGKITDIQLIEHKNAKGAKAESIINDILEKQTTDVEMVSGATISSKVIRKAVEYSLVK